MNKLNKIRLFLFGTLSFVCIGNLHAQQTMGLDEVIVQAAKDMEARLSAGAKLAVLNFTSTAEAFSDYVIEELSGALVMNRKVTVIERKSLDLVRKEMNLQLSGDVSDDSAQAIGKQLGAQAIVTGSLTNLGDTYRFRVKVINVETARIEAQFSYNLGNNRQVAFLLKESQQTAPSADSAQEQATPKSSQTAKVYKVGDTGPAGGIIFYDKGNNSGGWRYLEAAPATTEAMAQWRHNSGALADTSGVIGENSKEVGMGQTNTQNIMRYFSQNGGGFGLAVQVCDELAVNGFDDWFLPSQNELSYMYGNLYRKGLGGFKNEWYYSSTIVKGNYSGGGSFAPSRINFANGEPSDGDSDVSRRVRAIRQF